MTLNILEEYLKEFKGSLLIVSHDRHFLDRVAEHLLVFCGKGVIKDFVGNFSEYRQYVRDYEAKLKQEENAKARKNKAEPTRATESRSANPEAPRKLSFKEKRELEQIEARLPELEEEKSTLENKMSSGALSYEELRQASERIEEIIAETDSLETRWLELQV